MLEDVTLGNSVDYALLNTANGRQFLSASGSKIYIIDMVTGQKLRTLFTNGADVIANKNEDLFISNDYYNDMYSATKYQEEEKLPLDNMWTSFN
jgi:hypothetical protein